MAAGVALQPVPPELSRVVNITCNDCEQSEDGRAWHFLGVQCMYCQSFNTVVDRLVLSGQEAYDFLEMRDAQDMVTEETTDGTGPARPRRRVNRRRSAF
jgi:Zinc-ribbon